MSPRILFLSLALLFPLFAIAQQPRNEIAVSYGRTETEELGDARPQGASYTRFWTGAVATRFGAQISQEDFPDDAGDKRFGAYSAIVEYHFLRSRTFSPYAGAGVAHAYARQRLRAANFTKDDSVITVIVDVGLDINVTPRVALGFSANYLKFDPDLGDRFGTILDPTTALVSAKYRF